MSDYAVVIGFKFTDEEYRSIILDTVDDVVVNGQSNVTEQPVVSGDVIADHSYIQPKTLDISGVISLEGSKVTMVDGQGSKLANFEELCDRIQREAVRCDIVKISIKNDNDIRFLHKHDMVLTGFRYSEKINTLPYSLSFKEVMTVEVKDVDVDTDDQYAPAITEPNTLSFSDTLIDWDAIDANTIKIMRESGVLKDSFLEGLKSLGSATVKSIVAGTAAVILVSVMSALNSTPVGWVLTAVGVAITAAVIFIKGIFNFFKKVVEQSKFNISSFEWSKDPKKNNAEVNRFAKFLEKLHNEIHDLDTSLRLYRISSNEPQECLIGIGDKYYIFTFTKNNTNNKYSLEVVDEASRSIASKTDITSSFTSFDRLTNNNMLFTAENNSKIYILFNPVKETDETKEQLDEKLDLTNYVVLVSDINVEDYNKLIEDIIKNAIFVENK